MLSRDDKVREAMNWFAENERICRCIAEDTDSDFLNWKDEPGEPGTASLTARTRKTCKKLKIGLKMIEDKMVVKTEESELKISSAVGIGRSLTQKVIRPGKYNKLIEHKVHGASYTTLKGNEVSNSMLTDIYTRKSDAFFRFVIVGRADLLPTPVNLRRWFGNNQEGTCRRCGQARQQTLAHILNECTPYYPLMTKRHNKLANVVRRGIEKFIANDLRSEIRENENIEEENLPEDLQRLRPDMVFERRRIRPIGETSLYAERQDAEVGNEERIIEMIEFSCPYGYISRGQDTLKRVYEEKKRKYQRLAMNLKQHRQSEVRITAVIVSSMGAVYNQSLKDLQKVIGCTDQKIRKLGRKMSETVIMGSMEIWRHHAHETEREPEHEANAMVEEEVALLDADAEQYEREMRMNQDLDLELEREREDGEEHQEDGLDDEFEPEDGLEDVDFLIDPGFITADETVEPERQQREWIQRRRENDIEERRDEEGGEAISGTETNTETEIESGRGREADFADDEGDRDETDQ
jgi:hypothetical protein